MIKLVSMGMLAAALSACAVVREPAVVETHDTIAREVFTRADIEARDARARCRALARNLVQIARCDGR